MAQIHGKNHESKTEHHAYSRGNDDKNSCFGNADQTNVLVPALDTAAPIRPPIKACEELLGRP